MTTRRRSSIFLLSVMALAACAEAPTAPMALHTGPFANAQPFLPGEQQPLVDPAFGLAIYPAGLGQILQQTFTPSSNQWLGYLELPVACGAGVLLNVKIREGLNGPIIYEMNVVGLPSDVPHGTFQLLQLFDPAVTAKGQRLRKGREYAFELAAIRGPGATGICSIAKGASGNSYAGGRGYYQDPINGPAFLPLPTGVATDDEDLPFRTLVR